jgi:Heparinase II/III-like protein/Heparinase II/III N-terminus
LAFDMTDGKTTDAVSDADPTAGAARLVEAIAEGDLADLRFASIHSVGARPEDVEEALRGTYRVGGQSIRLEPPVDWRDEPYRAPEGRAFFQNSFVFAEPLLGDERFPQVLDRLADLFADWLAANPRGAEPSHRYAWHDHAAAGRLVYMAFVLREGVRRDAFDPQLARTLAAGVLDHVDFLLPEENYAAHYNHGLFSDAALALAARSLAPAPEAARWREIAERRFAAVLESTIAPLDALHLEHSPYYHWVIHRALCRFAAAGLFEDLDLIGLTQRMAAAGTWLVAPDGTLPQIGDTPAGERLPADVRPLADSNRGLRVFAETGYAVVRDGESALFVTAAHHPTAHKHADDGSFCLYEDGLPLVTDSGDPGHDYESVERRYGTSPAAHATISVDDHDWRQSDAHGSGILDAAEGSGLYAVLVEVPGAVPGSGRARRVLLYVPRRFLVVVDEVEAGAERTLTRHLPLAPDLGATTVQGGRIEIHRGGAPVASLVPFGLGGAGADGIELAAGRRAPTMAGFTFPAPGSSCPRVDLRLSAAAGEPRAFALSLDGSAIDPELGWHADEGNVRLRVAGLASSVLSLELAGDSIEGLGLTPSPERTVEAESV